MTEITKTESQKPKTRNQIIWLSFALITIAVYFFGLSIPLLGPDEPRYAQVAREMFERGDWVTPTLGGFGWFEKPALLYWLEIVSYKIFGVSEFAARFGSAIFGLATVFCLWILGRKSLPANINEQPANHESRITNHEFANWLALISASSVGLIAFSHAASFDIILTFPLTASLVGFFIFEQSENNSATAYRLPLAAYYFFIGVALIAKGLVGIVFPFAIVAFYYLLSWKFPSKTFLVSLVWGTILILLTAAIWYVPVYQANGWKFIDEFFIQHHFQRYVSNKYQHPEPFWFFWVILPLMTLPWLPFFLASLWNYFKDVFRRKDVKENHESRIPNHKLRRFAFAWMFVPLVFFSLSGSKLPGYILPALPAASILTTQFIVNFVRNNPIRKIALQSLATLVFILTVITLQFFVEDFTHGDTTKNLLKTANEQGFSNARILNLHTESFNAEFYGAGRIVRSDDGKILRLYGPAEVFVELQREHDKPVLVLVPLQYASQLSGSDLFFAKLLGENGELALFAVEKAK